MRLYEVFAIAKSPSIASSVPLMKLGAFLTRDLAIRVMEIEASNGMDVFVHEIEVDTLEDFKGDAP